MQRWQLLQIFIKFGHSCEQLWRTTFWILLLPPGADRVKEKYSTRWILIMKYSRPDERSIILDGTKLWWLKIPLAQENLAYWYSHIKMTHTSIMTTKATELSAKRHDKLPRTLLEWEEHNSLYDLKIVANLEADISNNQNVYSYANNNHHDKLETLVNFNVSIDIKAINDTRKA